ncbi:MAG: D-alanyl-D-alanine carboxypeptidase, partial [Gemmatimonadaceae bacterium]|nr:D-alanyl-D-alanine carboxypeptidase [Chitinophagaceae bacterium]
NGISGIRVHDGESGSLLSIPEGYIWQDIGNYYGAGTSLVNWNENQYDIRFESTAFGKSAKISGTDPPQTHVTFTNDIKAAAPGSGDNAFIFCAPFTTMAYLKGTIPAGSSFKISGAMPHASLSLAQELYRKIRAAGMMADSNLTTTSQVSGPFEKGSIVAEHKSPAFDSLNFYFLRRSVNLYGEAFVKTIAKEKTGQYSLDTGLNIIRYFWSQRGIDKSAINIADGSGLSPQNRVTADALVKVLQFARTRSWYNSFYTALPVYNGMKLKSGSIGGSRAFAGYHTSVSGTTYSIAMLINNYDGSSATAVNKMFKLLDLLK